MTERGSIKIDGTTYSLSYKERGISSIWVVSSSNSGGSAGFEFELNKPALAAAVLAPSAFAAAQISRWLPGLMG